MSIKVKRNKGMMGGTAKVSLSVDGKNVHKLGNNESYMIDSNKNTTKIKATQWFFGSPEKEVTNPSSIEIKINTTALFLFILSLVLIFVGVAISPIVVGIGVIGAVVTMVYAAKNWFELEEIHD